MPKPTVNDVQLARAHSELRAAQSALELRQQRATESELARLQKDVRNARDRLNRLTADLQPALF